MCVLELCRTYSWKAGLAPRLEVAAEFGASNNGIFSAFSFDYSALSCISLYKKPVYGSYLNPEWRKVKQVSEGQCMLPYRLGSGHLSESLCPRAEVYPSVSIFCCRNEIR